MEEQLLQEVAKFTEKWIKDQIKNRDFNRPSKVGGVINPSPRKIKGTGRLYNSVETRVEDGDIIVLMEFYGADILFGEGRRVMGSKTIPESGKEYQWYVKGQPPSDKIREWARIAIPGFIQLSQSKQKGLAFVIARNIGLRGIGALNLFNLYDEEVFEVFEEEINKLIEREDFQGLGLDVEEILDRIVLLSNESFELSVE